MIYTEAMEITVKSGITYDVEVTIDQYQDIEFGGYANNQPLFVSEIKEIRVFDSFFEDVTDELDSDVMEEIEEIVINRDFLNTDE